jgi:hypothetical protein
MFGSLKFGYWNFHIFPGSSTGSSGWLLTTRLQVRVLPGEPEFKRGLFETPFEFWLLVMERTSVSLSSFALLWTSSLNEGSPVGPF